MRVSRRRTILSSIAIAGTMVLFAGYLILRSDASGVRAGRLPPDRICPVQSCAGYPQPDRVKGITLATLTNYVVFTKAARAQIRAARAWGANAVRIQIVQDKLVGQAGRKLSPVYLADIRRLVGYALGLQLTVILNAQTELSTGFPADENLPTRATYSFWRYLADFYRNNPHVVFDLFNEPRFCDWPQWDAAFQPLVDYLRRIGSRNQLWVEGIRWGSTLAGARGCAGRASSTASAIPVPHGRGRPRSGQPPGTRRSVTCPASTSRCWTGSSSTTWVATTGPSPPRWFPSICGICPGTTSGWSAGLCRPG